MRWICIIYDARLNFLKTVNLGSPVVYPFVRRILS
jgi:hypothetical protein